MPTLTLAYLTALALCAGKPHDAAGICILADMPDSDLQTIATVLIAADYSRPRYIAVPGSTHDYAIRSLRRGFDLAYASR